MKFVFSTILALAAAQVSAKNGPIALPTRAAAQVVFDYWTPERIASARPRDYYVDLIHGVRQLRERQLQTTNEGAWDLGGDIQSAAGRILFTMGGSNYVCSGTVIEEAIAGRSIVITAGHCAYDDVAKEFASMAMFIPNQDGTTGTGTDSDCTNDPHGCYAASFGVVDGQWADQTWSSNIPWDYAYYVFPDSGAHTGPGLEQLDAEVPTMPVDFSYVVQDGDLITAFGYSYSEDPDFRFCKLNADVLSGSIELDGCGMSGGASGGPWILGDLNDGTGIGRGPIISVNSYGPTRGKAYMGGPKLNDSAECLKTISETAIFANVTDMGLVVDYDGGSCDPREGGSGGEGGDGGSGTCQAVTPSCNDLCDPSACCDCANYVGCGQGGRRSLCTGVLSR